MTLYFSAFDMNALYESVLLSCRESIVNYLNSYSDEDYWRMRASLDAFKSDLSEFLVYVADVDSNVVYITTKNLTKNAPENINKYHADGNSKIWENCGTRHYLYSSMVNDSGIFYSIRRSQTTFRNSIYYGGRLGTKEKPLGALFVRIENPHSII